MPAKLNANNNYNYSLRSYMGVRLTSEVQKLGRKTSRFAESTVAATSSARLALTGDSLNT